MANETTAATVEVSADKKLLLNAKEVRALLGLSVETLRVRCSNFPATVYTHTSRTLWRRSDIEKWVESLPVREQ